MTTPHDHIWSHTALWTAPGELSTPCVFNGCADALVVWQRQHVAINTFPLAICGTPLDLRDVDGPGAVVKLVCHEATHVYRLDTIPLEPGDLVLDIGAHVGAVSCWVAKVHPAVEVHAVEPMGKLFDLALRNIERNVGAVESMVTISDPAMHSVEYNVGAFRVTVWNRAVTSDGRSVAIVGRLSANSGGASIYDTHLATDEDDGGWVESVTLESLLTRRAKLLKIDCEGAEHEVLTDAVLEQVDWLVGEFHHAPSRGHDAHALLARVQAKLGADKVRVTVVNV